jgi:hypothetical protein
MLWTLEERLLLTAGDLELAIATTPPAIPGQTIELSPLPAYMQQAVPSAPNMSSVTHPLSDVPALSSLPGASASLYLNFTGDSTQSYGRWGYITTPAFDQDGDATSFSDSELATIQEIWSYVAEDYAPFSINVTTVPPSNMSHGVTEKVDIGGDGAWTGGRYAGMTYVNDFTQTGVPNIAFVFPENLINGGVPGYAKYTGDAVSHEAGHGFGLNHQSVYSGSTLTQEYNTGPGDGTAPLMGNSYPARRSLWWYGQSDVSSTTYQDDMAVIGSSTNGFGFRPLPGNSTSASAIPLLQNGTQVSDAGLIIHPSDLDYYSFTSGPGVVSFTVSVPADVSNLAPKVELLDATGSTVMAAAGPSASDFSASITATLSASGSYRLLVANDDGSHGNVGHYRISGTVAAPSNSGGGTGSGTGAGTIALNPPANLSAGAVSPYRVDLAWSDVASKTGFRIERTVDGSNWLIVGNVGMGITAFSDLSVAPGTTYAYRVRSLRGNQVSAPSTTTLIATPAPPSSPTAVSTLTVVSVAPRQVVLFWLPSGPGTQGYTVERSTNGRRWTAVGILSGSGSTSFADRSVGPGKTYLYRVRASSALGSSPPSLVKRVATPRAAPAARIRTRVR